MPQAKNRRRRRAGSPGYSLVEVMVAMLIASVMVTAVLGVAVTATKGDTKSSHRQLMNGALTQLSAQLKNYQTACGCYKSNGDCTSSGGCTEILGPNSNNAGAATWSLNGAPGPAGNLADTSFGNSWALACGVHNVTGLVPALEAAPYSATVSYTVTWPTCSAAVPALNESPSISFNTNWTEPGP
jgi:prepilin-type N-terminal cleavage/methylation domain-containing protein